MIWHRLKRWLYLIHRWLGIATCLLFVLWFASGLVMLYVPFPMLEGSERLRGLSPIAWDQVQTGYPKLWIAHGEENARQVVLEMRGDRPIWRISPWDEETVAFWADNGLVAGRASETEARQIAQTFGREEVEAIHLIYNDQWTVAGGYDFHRPLWKAELANDNGRVLYVSSNTGEVVLDTAAKERFWNWLGSIPHWLYVRALREEQPLWRQVVMWVSGPCILVAFTGIWIGIMRLKTGTTRIKGNRMSPYRGWMKWHHVSGVIGSAFLLLWIFSGWLSVDPGRLFASGGIGTAAFRSYAGDQPLPHLELSTLARLAPNAHQVTLQSAAGRPFLRIRKPEQADRLLEAVRLKQLVSDDALLRSATARLLPWSGRPVFQTLAKPDAYWYAVHGNIQLPVLRVRFDDPAQTWLHIDPVTGEILGETDARRRTYRWLFDLFHRWDLDLLLRTPPSRDLLIWLMSIVGLISSVTAAAIGWKRLRRPRGVQRAGRRSLA